MIDNVLRRPLFAGFILLALLLTLLSSVVIVPETRQALIVQFGKPDRILNRTRTGEVIGSDGAGLAFKVPFFEDIVWIDKRVRDLDMEDVRRQVEGWSGRYRRARTEDVADFEATMAWLDAHQPPDRTHVLVHNDFRFDNLVLAADDPTRVVAVLDWELATVGDPLMDLGSALAYWVQADDDPAFEAEVLAEVASRGEATARDIDDGAPRSREHWGWNWSAARKMLDYLYMSGQIAIARRNGQFEVVYAPLEKVLPPEVLAAMDADQFAAAWHQALTRPPDARNRVLVALERNSVRGFAVTQHGPR